MDCLHRPVTAMQLQIAWRAIAILSAVEAQEQGFQHREPHIAEHAIPAACGPRTLIQRFGKGKDAARSFRSIGRQCWRGSTNRAPRRYRFTAIFSSQCSELRSGQPLAFSEKACDVGRISEKGGCQTLFLRGFSQ